MAEAFFLVSLIKGLEVYKKPLFWAVVYVLFLLSSDYMFQAAVLHNYLKMAGCMVLNLGLGYGYFTLLKETENGLPYWGTFVLGFVLLVFFVP